MADENESVALEQAYIPANFAGNVNLLGFTFALKRLGEGVISAIVMFFAGYEFGYWTLVIDSQTVNATIGIIAAVLAFATCAVGLNRGDAFSFLYCWFRSLSRRRLAKYNPRVKYEDAVARSIQSELSAFYGPQKTEEYKSGWQRLVEKVKGKNIEGEAARNAARQQFDSMEANSEYTIFSDDVNVVNKRERRKSGIFKRRRDRNAEEEE